MDRIMTQAPGLVECQPAIRMRNISKEFYGQRVLTGVDLDLQAGELHAILGENGAGKSTLCSILAGLYQATSGEISRSGEPFAPRSPHDALAAGIGMVYQHFRLVDQMTVAEKYPSRTPPSRCSSQRERDRGGRNDGNAGAWRVGRPEGIRRQFSRG